MFTGIVEEVGRVRQIISGGIAGQIAIAAGTVLEATKPGDSIAVNGVCLTVTGLTERGFTADVMPETLRRSNLGCLRAGDPVNLERAVAANGRFGGHFVSGHIDGTGTIRHKRKEGNAVWINIKASTEVIKLVVEKGSIAIDGVSLTVAAVGNEDFEVSVIPHTGQQTALLNKKEGDPVNLENDLIGKYVQRLLSPGCGRPSGGVTLDFLKQQGF